MIKGQEKLFKEIDSFVDVPHSILLIGEEGSGKHKVCEYISDKFNLVKYDITEMLTDEYISEINQSQTKSLYIVDLDEINFVKQNIILKLFEEPSKFVYIILICSNKEKALDTILSRSYILQMSSFTKEYLSTLTDNEYALKVCTTPGQIEVANRTDMEKLRSVCVNLLERIQDAPLFNLLSVVDKINFSDEYNKFDLSLFLRSFNYECTKRTDCLDIYLIFKNMNIYIRSMNNKKFYFERCLIEAYENRRIKK